VITLGKAITSLSTSCEWQLVGGEITWLSETHPTTEEVLAEQTRLQAVYDSQEYARLRKAKYDLLNQFEMRFDDQINSTTTWVDAINAIKAAHPKP